MSDRVHRPEVDEILTARLRIGLCDNQTFYSTDKAWEIWETGPLPRRIKRIDAKFVYHIREK